MTYQEEIMLQLTRIHRGLRNIQADLEKLEEIIATHN